MVKVVSRSFTIDQAQLKKLHKWKRSLPKLSNQDSLRAYTYEFNPLLDGEVVSSKEVSFKKNEDFKNKIKVKRFDGHEITL